MNLLALDLSSNTGWAIGPVGQRPRYGTLRLPSTGNEIGRFADAFDTWLSDMITMYAPDFCAFESSFIPPTTTLMTVRKLTGLAWHTEFVCRRRDVTCTEVNNATVKKFWAGTGRAKKPEMIAAARGFGFPVDDDNQADALGLWHHVCEVKHPGRNEWMCLGRLGGGS